MQNTIQTYLRQSWLVIVLALVLGGSLAVVDQSLQARIQRNAEARLRQAILEVVPAGATYESHTVGEHAVFRVRDGDGQLVGWAIRAQARGFQDRIGLLIGLSASGDRIRGLAVLDSNETPGLGERIRDDEFRRQFVDKPASTLEVVRPGQTAKQPIHAITGATITSAAVTRAVNEQLRLVGGAIGAEANRDDHE